MDTEQDIGQDTEWKTKTYVAGQYLPLGVLTVHVAGEWGVVTTDRRYYSTSNWLKWFEPVEPPHEFVLVYVKVRDEKLDLVFGGHYPNLDTAVNLCGLGGAVGVAEFKDSKIVKFHRV